MKSICVHLISWMLCGVFLGSCQENTAFTAGKCHSVQQLLDSKEAKVACDEKASFEGKTLCLSGLLEVSNDPRPLPRNFFLLSTINPNRAVEIQFEAEVAAKIIPKVRSNRGKTAKILGTVTGFGHAGNPNCKRTFILKLANEADFSIE